MKKVKLLSVLTTVLLSMILLIGCSIKAPTSGQSKQSEQQSVNSQIKDTVKEEILFCNWNVGVVSTSPQNPATFTISEPYAITNIDTYHYGGTLPAGTLSLKHSDGTVYGPWDAVLDSGGTVWVVNNKVSGQYEDYRTPLGSLTPDAKYPVIKAGEYTVIDSSPDTWSQNTESGSVGFTQVKGYKVSAVK